MFLSRTYDFCDELSFQETCIHIRSFEVLSAVCWNIPFLWNMTLRRRIPQERNAHV